jgi:hypothetical protein
MSAPVPPADPPSNPGRRPRRPRPGREDGETFGQLTPWQNPAAVYAYYVGLAGLMPVVGAMLGLAALLLGLTGLIRVRRRPEIEGTNFAVAGIALGALEVVFNVAGVWCLGHGMEWW